jgi:hypothetical protein
VDTVVSHELFAEQLGEVRESDLFSINHWELLRMIYPTVLIRMRHPSGATRNFLLDFSRYDDFPPSIKLVDESDAPVLDAAKLPQGGPHFFRYNAPTSPYRLCATTLPLSTTIGGMQARIRCGTASEGAPSTAFLAY